LYKVLAITTGEVFGEAEAVLKRVSDKEIVTPKVMNLLPAEYKQGSHSEYYREICVIV
jgi:hypothetical protein